MQGRQSPTLACVAQTVSLMNADLCLPAPIRVQGVTGGVESMDSFLR